MRSAHLSSGRHYLRVLDPPPPPELRRAHDVRHLVICGGCRCLADERHCVRRDGKPYHGRCFQRRFGMRALQAVPREERGGLQLSDIGLLAARALIAGDARAERQ